MARPAKTDWAEVAAQYAAAQAETGIGAKEWCEQNGHSYQTARRYLKTRQQSPAQPEQFRAATGNAQKPVRKTAQNCAKPSKEVEQALDELIEDGDITPQQARFVTEYCKDMNASQAAIRAGYSEQSAGQLGWQLMQKPTIKAAIDRQLKAMAASQMITAERILAELALLGFSNLQDVVDDIGEAKPISQLSREHAATIKEIRVRGGENPETVVKLHDKQQALVKLGERLQLFAKPDKASQGAGVTYNFDW